MVEDEAFEMNRALEATCSINFIFAIELLTA
jgi:hypothetical protein